MRSRSNWKCWFWRRGENWRTRRKPSRSKGENQQQTGTRYGTRNRCLTDYIIYPLKLSLFSYLSKQTKEHYKLKTLVRTRMFRFLAINDILLPRTSYRLQVKWSNCCSGRWKYTTWHEIFARVSFLPITDSFPASRGLSRRGKNERDFG